MAFALVSIGTVAMCFLLGKPLRRYPFLFYSIAIAATLLFIASSYVYLPSMVGSTLFFLMRKCTLPLALFFVVMFIGVFSDTSKIKRFLKPIRAQLSIIAWILSLGHIVVYAGSYAPRFVGLRLLEQHMVASFAVAVVLFALLLVLGVTSFNFVKSRMSAMFWLKVQRWAYVFFALVYVHVALALAPAALSGGAAARVSMIAYSSAFAAYGILRMRRAWKSRVEATASEAAGSLTVQ